MRYTQFSLFSLTCLLLVQTSGFATDLSLETAIQDAKKQSPAIAKATAVLDETRWKQEAALAAGFFPKITAGASHYFSHDYQILDVPLNGNTVSFPTIYPSTSYGIQAKLPLFDGFASIALLDGASLARQAAEKELKQAEFQVEEDVKLAYFQAVTAEKIQAVTARHVTTLEEHAKLTNLQKQGGTATYYDVLRVQVQLSEAQLDSTDAIDNVAISKQKLAQLMGKKETDQTLVTELPAPSNSKVSQLILDGELQNRKDLEALVLRKESLHKLEGMDTDWFMPKIDAVGAYDLYNNRNDSVFGDDFRTASQTGVILSWTIFDGNQGHAKREGLKAQQAQLDSTIQELTLKAATDFMIWKKKYATHTLRFEVKNLDAQRSEESLRLAKLGYKAGSRTSTDVLDAELDLFKSKAGSVLAQMSAVEALIKLELTLGRTL